MTLWHGASQYLNPALNVIYNLHVVGQVAYFEKLTVKELSHYSNKIESTGLRKA